MRALSKTVLSVVVASAMLSAGQAHAQYYGGVLLSKAPRGETAIQSNQFGFNGGESPSELIALANLTNGRSGLSLSSEPSLGIRFGYRFTPYFSVEGNFADRSLNTQILRSDGAAKPLREQSMGLDLVGTLPLLKKLSLQARAGLRNDFKIANETYGVNGTNGQSQSGILAITRGFSPTTSGVIGIGLQYNLNQSLGLKFEVERTRKFFIDRLHGDTDNVSLGVMWRF